MKPKSPEPAGPREPFRPFIPGKPDSPLRPLIPCKPGDPVPPEKSILAELGHENYRSTGESILLAQQTKENRSNQICVPFIN